jgi:hypothetical protein
MGFMANRRNRIEFVINGRKIFHLISRKLITEATHQLGSGLYKLQAETFICGIDFELEVD